MLICGDGSSKQRGHGESRRSGIPGGEGGAAAERVGGAVPAGHAGRDRRVRRELLPVLRGHRPRAARALGRLEVPVRCRRRWWSIAIRIRPARASPLKAYYVERNRLFLLVKNFPAGDAAGGALRSALARYFWHAWYYAGRDRAPRRVPRGRTGGADGVGLVRVAGARGAAGNWRRAVAASGGNLQAGAHRRRSSFRGCCGATRSAREGGGASEANAPARPISLVIDSGVQRRRRDRAGGAARCGATVPGGRCW